jgi:hypothetical protein
MGGRAGVILDGCLVVLIIRRMRGRCASRRTVEESGRAREMTFEVGKAYHDILDE